MKTAGSLAGLEVLRIINEPTAAAVAYGYDRAPASETERLGWKRMEKGETQKWLPQKLDSKSQNSTHLEKSSVFSTGLQKGSGWFANGELSLWATQLAIGSC